MSNKQLEKKLKELKEKKESLELTRHIKQVEHEMQQLEEPSKFGAIMRRMGRGAKVVGKGVGKGIMKAGENMSKADVNEALVGRKQTEKKTKVQD